MEILVEEKEKSVGSLMFLKNGHFWMSFTSKGHSDPSPFIPFRKKSIASFAETISSTKQEKFTKQVTRNQSC